MLKVLLAPAIALTIIAVAWFTLDWLNAFLDSPPVTLESGSVALGITTWVLIPIIVLFNILAAPAALVVAVLEPICGCGTAVTGPVLIALAVLCGLTSGGLWLSRRHG